MGDDEQRHEFIEAMDGFLEKLNRLRSKLEQDEAAPIYGAFMIATAMVRISAQIAAGETRGAYDALKTVNRAVNRLGSQLGAKEHGDEYLLDVLRVVVRLMLSRGEEKGSTKDLRDAGTLASGAIRYFVAVLEGDAAEAELHAMMMMTMSESVYAKLAERKHAGEAPN